MDEQSWEGIHNLFSTTFCDVQQIMQKLSQRFLIKYKQLFLIYWIQILQKDMLPYMYMCTYSTESGKAAYEYTHSSTQTLKILRVKFFSVLYTAYLQRNHKKCTSSDFDPGCRQQIVSSIFYYS